MQLYQAKPWALSRSGTFSGTRRAGLHKPPRPRKQVVAATWDPDGLLPAHSSGGHFARRDREKASQLSSSQLENEAESLLAAALGRTRPLQALPREWQQQGEGIPASQMAAGDRQALAEQLKLHFMPVDLDYPGLRVQHLDPPVFTVEDFFSSEQCDELVDAARQSGELRASKIGAGNATLAASNAYHSRRTSTSMVIEHGPVFRSRFPRISAVASVLQEQGLRLFGAGEGREWGTPGRLPVPQQYAYEGLQVTKYERSQHFLAHEDAFPVATAVQNKFNRHATLLVYLNEVPEGGATRFNQLNLAVRPKKGMALLFFPSFADGTPDARTLHTAEGAVDDKWVTQQWVARGLAAAPALAGSRSSRPLAAAGAVGQPKGEGKDEQLVGSELVAAARKSKKGGSKTRKAAPAGKGFGSK